MDLPISLGVILEYVMDSSSLSLSIPEIESFKSSTCFSATLIQKTDCWEFISGMFLNFRLQVFPLASLSDLQ